MDCNPATNKKQPKKPQKISSEYDITLEIYFIILEVTDIP